MLGLDSVHLLLVLQKVIVDMHDHETGEVPHEWFCLHLDVPDNIVTAPASNQLNYVAADSQIE